MTHEAIRFDAPDGWSLEGDLHRGDDPKMAVLISGGTGFPRRFYRHLAAWLAAEGAVVLTFDYRGIGGSAAGDPARRDIEYHDWGRYDQAAALDALEAAGPGLPIGHVAHSVGGHFIGLMSNHEKIRRHAFVAVGSGHWRHHKPHYVPTAMYFWWVLGPWSLMRHGYLKPGGGWGGEALPHGVFTTWRRWAHQRDYLAGDIQTRFGPHAYDQVRAPIRTWLFSDDPIATERAAPGILDNYPNAPKDYEKLTPAAVGVKRIGHEGAFRPGREALWRRWRDWLAA